MAPIVIIFMLRNMSKKRTPKTIYLNIIGLILNKLIIYFTSPMVGIFSLLS